MDQGCRLCIEPRKSYNRGLMIASSTLEVKADGLRKPEGSRPGYAMASVEVTTGVRDQGMHSQGWRGNSGEPFVSLYKSR